MVFFDDGGDGYRSFFLVDLLQSLVLVLWVILGRFGGAHPRVEPVWRPRCSPVLVGGECSLVAAALLVHGLVPHVGSLGPDWEATAPELLTHLVDLDAFAVSLPPGLLPGKSVSLDMLQAWGQGYFVAHLFGHARVEIEPRELPGPFLWRFFLFFQRP